LRADITGLIEALKSFTSARIDERRAQISV